MDPDVIVDGVGAFGFYQKRLLFILWVIAVFNSWPSLSVVFTHYVPEYQCKYDSNSSIRLNMQVSDYWNTSLFKNISIEEVENHCNQTSPCSDWVFDTKNDGGETVVSEMNLVCDRDWILPMILSVSMAGEAVGVGICGTLADRFGRRPVYLGSSITIFVSALGMSLSNNIVTYGIFLTLAGASSTIQYLIICIIGSEMIEQKYRQYVVMSALSGYIFGYLTLPLLAFLTNGWRTMLYAITVGTCAFTVGFWYCTETVRWLIFKKDWKKANKLIAEIARVNKSKLEIEEILERHTSENSTEIEPTGKEENIVQENATSLIRNPTMLIRLVVSMFIWCVTCFVYYAIVLNTSFLHGDRYINCFISALMEIPSLILGHALMGKIGRVKTNFLFFIVSGLALISAHLLTEVSYIAVSAFAIGGKTAITGAFYVNYVHAVEIAPTSNRGLFMNICCASARLGTILAPYMMYLGRTDTSEAIVYMFMGISSVLAGILTILFLPETIGKPLPDTTEEAKNRKTLRFHREKKNNEMI